MWWVLLALVMATRRRKKGTKVFGDSCKREGDCQSLKQKKLQTKKTF
jgi:hypothetical protein